MVYYNTEQLVLQWLESEGSALLKIRLSIIIKIIVIMNLTVMSNNSN